MNKIWLKWMMLTAVAVLAAFPAVASNLPSDDKKQMSQGNTKSNSGLVDNKNAAMSLSASPSPTPSASLIPRPSPSATPSPSPTPQPSQKEEIENGEEGSLTIKDVSADIEPKMDFEPYYTPVDAPEELHYAPLSSSLIREEAAENEEEGEEADKHAENDAENNEETAKLIPKPFQPVSPSPGPEPSPSPTSS